MRLLLINNNPAVSRLINLSAEKYGYEIEEFRGDDFDLNENFDITIADNEAVSDNSMLLLRESGSLGEIIYIGPKGLPKPIYANYFLQKPFLPTDFIDLVKKIEKSLKKEDADEDNTQKTETFIDDTEPESTDTEEDKTIALDLDDMDSLDLPMPDDDDDLMAYKEEKLEEEIREQSEEAEDEESNLEVDEQEIETDEHIEDILAEDDGKSDNETEDEEESSDNEQDDEVPEELKLDEDTQSEDEGTAILDSEEIDEVKQLLDDEIESDVLKDEESDELSGIEDDETPEEDKETDDGFDMEEDLLIGETNIEEAMEDISQESEVLGDIVQDGGDLEEPEEILKEIENIEDESISETEDYTEETEVQESEEIVAAPEDIATVSSEEKATIDDILEEDLDGLFDESDQGESTDDKSIDIEDVKEELQTKIVSDVKKVLDKDEIREALKGLKVNISITFDEE